MVVVRGEVRKVQSEFETNRISWSALSPKWVTISDKLLTSAISCLQSGSLYPVSVWLQQFPFCLVLLPPPTATDWPKRHLLSFGSMVIFGMHLFLLICIWVMNTYVVTEPPYRVCNRVATGNNCKARKRGWGHDVEPMRRRESEERCPREISSMYVSLATSTFFLIIFLYY